MGEDTRTAGHVAPAGPATPDPVVPQKANTEVAPAAADNVTGTSPDPAPAAEDQTPDPATPPAEATVADPATDSTEDTPAS